MSTVFLNVRSLEKSLGYENMIETQTQKLKRLTDLASFLSNAKFEKQVKEAYAKLPQIQTSYLGINISDKRYI